MNETTKKKHLYSVNIAAGEPKTVFVLAQSKQQAINGVAARYMTAARADAIDVLRAGISMDQVIDAGTAHAAQEPLPLPTAAEEMEPLPVAAEPEVADGNA